MREVTRNLKNSFIKKTIVFGTIVLFFTVTLVSATNKNVELTNVINDIKKS